MYPLFSLLNASKEEGHSLLEMAIVLAIIGIIGSFSFPLIQQIYTIKKTKLLEENKEIIVYSLVSFLLRENRLPCPSTLQSNGVEQNICYQSLDYIGLVPFRTLGIAEKITKYDHEDRIMYAVEPNLTQTTSINSDVPRNLLSYCTTYGDKLALKDDKDKPLIENSQDFVAIVLWPQKEEKELSVLEEQEILIKKQLTKISSKKITWIGRHHLIAYYGRSPCSSIKTK